MTKGIVIIAQNTSQVDYIKCAEVLSKSIRQVMPNIEIALLSDSNTDNKNFDRVLKFPYGDLGKDSNWKLINDWQIFEASPYDQTLKLEADLFLPKSIDYWFEVLCQQDVVVSTTIRNYKQEISDCRYYRRFIDYNKLPNCYNALTYFQKTKTSEYFFHIVRNVFENWEEYKKILQCKQNENVTTDWAYAIACHIIGIEKTTMPMFTDMSMIHMKQMVNGTNTEDWTDELIYELSLESLRINTISQRYPFHYQVKNFCDKLEKLYE